MKFIVRKKVGSVVIQVDAQDAHLLRNFVWTLHVNETGQTYFRRVHLGVTITLHREIMSANKDEIVRFRNGDQFDMRRANLIKESLEQGRAHLASHMLAVTALYRFVKA